ncbi:hypothetical protein [Nonomuraea sp. NPDC049480]|uniref:hypothetical protein n=1 Tax=Nonomuraea sp. NPDC049480 TaxID=3364353 RepID=UPI003788B923
MMAKLRRREATWPGLAIGFAIIFGLRLLDVIPPSAVFTAIALTVLVLPGGGGLVLPRRPGCFIHRVYTSGI